MENLLNFPQSTFVDKLIPKAKFVKASDTPTAMRDLLTEEFEQIRLMYVLRADTLNIEPGNEVKEIDVFYFRCKGDKFSVNPFCALDNLIPRHTLYVIEYARKSVSKREQSSSLELPSENRLGEAKYDVLMQHKRRTIVAGLPKWVREVSQWQSDVSLADLGLRIEGMNLDRVYFNLLSQVSGYRVDNSETLIQINALEDEISKKRRQAEVLQKQVRRERQFNLQVELNSHARAIKKEITELSLQLNELKNNQE